MEYKRFENTIIARLDKGEEKMIVDTSKNGTYSVTLDEGDNYLTLEGNDFCGSLQVVVE